MQTSATALVVLPIATEPSAWGRDQVREITRITLLQIGGKVSRGSEVAIQFRNIPFSNLSEVGSSFGFSQTESSQGVRLNRGRGSGIRHKTFRIRAAEWTDTGIDVDPGVTLELTARGTISTDGLSDSVAGAILNDVFRRRPTSRTRSSRRTAVPSAVLAKIRYANGDESNAVVVGSRNSVTTGLNEYGRLLVGIDKRYSSYSNGSFVVGVNW